MVEAEVPNNCSSETRASRLQHGLFISLPLFLSWLTHWGVERV